MNLNLSLRIFTSIILLVILFFGLYLDKFIWLGLLILSSIISFYEFFNLIKKKYNQEKYKIYLLNILSLIYLTYFIFAGYSLYEKSTLILLFIILVCIFSDIGGYIIGKSIGGKKLTKISPNKTISGSIGSFFFSLLPLIIFENIFENFINENIFIYILICLFLSLICQLGDLSISFFKRKANVKDTGTILPGHGGLLDRIDGIIFVLPIAYILDKIIS